MWGEIAAAIGVASNFVISGANPGRSCQERTERMLNVFGTAERADRSASGLGHEETEELNELLATVHKVCL